MISFSHNLFTCDHIVWKFCTEYSNGTVIGRAKYKRFKFEMDVIDERDFTRSGINLYGYIILQQPPEFIIWQCSRIVFSPMVAGQHTP